MTIPYTTPTAPVTVFTNNALTFADLVGEVIAIRFNQSDHDRAQRWVNGAYSRLWNTDEWIFKYASTNVTVTNNSAAVTNLPTDFGMPIAFYRADGTPLMYKPPRDFFNIYGGTPAVVAAACHYTIIDQQITVGPTSNETSGSYQLVYERRFAPMFLDGDTPAIPAAHHYLLVTGAMSEGLRLYNDFTWEFQEQAFLAGIQEMRREWLAEQRGEAGVWGLDHVEIAPTYFWG